MSTRSGPIRHPGPWLYALFAGLVYVGLSCGGGDALRDRLPHFSQAEESITFAGIPSRKLRPTGPRLSGPGGAPHCLTDLDQTGAVWLSPGVRWIPAGVGLPRAARIQEVALAAGG